VRLFHWAIRSLENQNLGGGRNCGTRFPGRTGKKGHARRYTFSYRRQTECELSSSSKFLGEEKETEGGEFLEEGEFLV